MGKTAAMILGGLLLLAIIIGAVVAGKYNTLVASRNNVDQQWSQVENQMQRRADLIPNLVGTVKGITGQEKDVFVKIAEARSQLLAAKTPDEKIQADNNLTSAMRDGGLLGTGGRFLSITEQYPQLKSSENFMKLQDELAGTENRMATARRDYNQSATTYNTLRQSFPTVLIAGIMGFPDKALFKADEGAKKAPSVNFSK